MRIPQRGDLLHQQASVVSMFLDQLTGFLNRDRILRRKVLDLVILAGRHSSPVTGANICRIIRHLMSFPPARHNESSSYLGRADGAASDCAGGTRQLGYLGRNEQEGRSADEPEHPRSGAGLWRLRKDQRRWRA